MVVQSRLILVKIFNLKTILIFTFKNTNKSAQGRTFFDVTIKFSYYINEKVSRVNFKGTEDNRGELLRTSVTAFTNRFVTKSLKA